jgi:hypothetical protein
MVQANQLIGTKVCGPPDAAAARAGRTLCGSSAALQWTVPGRAWRHSVKMRWLLIAAMAASLMAAPGARAQDGPEKGGHEFQFWTGGGVSRAGGVRDISMWNLGFRYGWILTEAHGFTGLRGRLEYALDATPIFWFFQPGSSAYGMGVSPLVLKWNFDAGNRIVPYVEVNEGLLVATHTVPPGGSHFNFTNSGAIGAHFLGPRANISAEIRLTHISDAGLTAYNPGVNLLQVRIGLGRFLRSN